MRLEVTRQADLAIRALVTLGDVGHSLSARRLAELLDATPGFMSQVMNPMVKAGWVASVPGRAGGYELARPLAELNVLEVVELADGPTDDGRCIVAGVPCTSHEPCPLHPAWAPARAVLIENLRARSLDTIPPPPPPP